MQTDKNLFVNTEWLRVILIILVVAHHAAQAYGPTGGDWPVTDANSHPYFEIFFLFNASFFMGFFFFLSGYFLEGSLERKGTKSFIISRLLRLGLPLFLISIFLFGLISYSESDSSLNYAEYLLVEYIGRGSIEMGHLWFIAHLLTYSFLYALWHHFFGNTSQNTPTFPRHRAVALYTVLLAIIGAAIRNFYPQDEWGG